MNSEITLEINGYRRDILRYNYRFSRNTDLKGRPTTGVLDGSIYIEMESDGDSSILDMMLVDMNKPRPSFFFRAEPASVSGRIRHTKDEMMLRELVFDEAYICCYGETMNATGNSPMITHFLISPTRLDINRTIRLDRRIKTTYGFWWEEYKEEEKKPIIPVAVSEPSKPIVLVTSVKGKDTALLEEVVEYKVTGYNLSSVSENDRNSVKWVTQIGEKRENLKERGESIKLTIKKEWLGKEIRVMPYLQSPTIKVCEKTKIRCKHVDGAIIVAEYIVNEIKTNTRSQIADRIRYWTLEEEYKKRYEEWKNNKSIGKYLNPPEPQNLLKAKILWTERVFAKRPWDHKPLIRNKFNGLAVERTEYSTEVKRMVTYKSYWHKYIDYDYYYDVWSNIHYGYVGLSVGFDEKTLLGGADLAQVIDSSGENAEDTGDDKTSIKIGFALYYKYGRYAEGLTAQDILNALDSSMMTESKRKHVCLEK